MWSRSRRDEELSEEGELYIKVVAYLQQVSLCMTSSRNPESLWAKRPSQI